MKLKSRLRSASVALALGVAMVLAATIVQADCLSSSVMCNELLEETTEATFHSECTNPVMYWATVDFNVPAHTMNLHYDESMRIALDLRDEFTITGPAPGTPVMFHLRLRYHGTAGGYGSGPAAGGVMSARALAPLPGEVTAQKIYGAPYGYGGWIPFSDSLDLVLPRTAGTPVGIELHANSSYGYYLNNAIQFEFLDLPPGSTVTSCKGYVQDQPTPVVAGSWGRLKAAYR